jgi:hypothetical protein
MQLTFILKRTLMGIMLALIIMALIAGGLYFWYFNRPLPPALTDQSLFEGITYTRIIRSEPVHQIIHIAKIDLTADGLSFLVTPSGDLENFDFVARTTSQFLEEFDLQLAINADFFDPWRDYSPFSYYPHIGDGTNVRGLSASQGDITTFGYVPSEDYVTLYLSKDNRASFTVPQGEIYNAVSGNISILQDGQIPQFEDESYLQKRHPRTAVGLSQDENTLILIVVDGRQPNYSDGATLPELSQMLLDAGADNAINLDGGGSSTIVMDDKGNPTQLNSPIQSRIPSRERPIANHLGVYAKPLP